MMAEYIEREDAIGMLRGSAIAKYPLSFYFGIFASADELEKLPAADVAPVRHGRWISIICSYGTPKCSVCDWSIPYSEDSRLDATNYCPNCGAKMDLEE